MAQHQQHPSPLLPLVSNRLVPEEGRQVGEEEHHQVVVVGHLLVEACIPVQTQESTIRLIEAE